MSVAKIFLNYRPPIHPTPSEFGRFGVAWGVVAKNTDCKFPQVTHDQPVVGTTGL